MTISKVREYLKQSIETVDSDFVQWKDAFNIDNIPGNLINKSYHIFYSIPSSVEDQTTLEDFISAEVNIFFSGYRNPADTLDVAMDLSNLVRLKAVSISNVESFKTIDDNPIYGSTCESIVPTHTITNDNQIIVTLQFTLRIAQTIC